MSSSHLGQNNDQNIKKYIVFKILTLAYSSTSTFIAGTYLSVSLIIVYHTVGQETLSTHTLHAFGGLHPELLWMQNANHCFVSTIIFVHSLNLDRTVASCFRLPSSILISSTLKVVAGLMAT